MASSGTLNLIERAHQMYRDGRYEVALGFYTEALAMAKTKPQRIALHSNRAACYLKLHDFKKAAEECTSVLELDHKHTGALMLRSQTLVTLKEYHSALFDVNRLIELDPSSEVYRNLESRLRTQLSLAPIPESEAELEEDEEEGEGEIEVDIKGDEAEIRRHVGLNSAGAAQGTYQENESDTTYLAQSVSSEIQPERESFEQRDDEKAVHVDTIPATGVSVPDAQGTKDDSKGWQAIPKPKGHSTLDYARWDSVEDNSSEDDDDDDDDECQYRFRVRTVGVRPVK
ncbi:hypothetical protein ACJRO7_026230 [Eucalyptus globulus]|uniref:Uncharacterized protein n=1 Tax=Eucalyptus globulus TaxID=34317 RepID=A0ABD3KBM9_EUCGL